MTLETFIRLGTCVIDPAAQVCTGAIIGKPFRPLLGGAPGCEAECQTTIGPNVYIGHYSMIGAGSTLSRGVLVDDFSIIECDVVVGQGSLAIYRAQICNEARIGCGCVIGGFVGERTVIGDEVRCFGKIVHSQRNPTRGWDDPGSMEESATIESGAFIGFDALIAGKVVVGRMAYVCAGAVVTRDVPPQHVAFGVNKIVPAGEWTGPLSKSPLFSQRSLG